MPIDFDIKTLGERVRQARRARDWTQRELADRAGLRAPHLLSYLERGGKTVVQADTLLGLAQALEVSTDYLLGLTDDPSPRPRARRKRAPQRDEDADLARVGG